MNSLSGQDSKVNQNQSKNVIDDGVSIEILSSDHWKGYTCIVNSIWIDKTLSSNQIRLLGIILTYGNYPGDAPRPISLSFLRKLSGMSNNTILLAIKALKKLGHIKEVIEPGPEQCRCVIVTSQYLLKNQKKPDINTHQGMSKTEGGISNFDMGGVSKFDIGGVSKFDTYIIKEEKVKKENNTHTRPLGRLREESEICLVEKKPIYDKSHESTEFCSAKAEPCVSYDFKPKRKKKRRAEESEIHVKIISYLNDKTGKKFRSNSVKSIDFINARLAEGYVLEDFKKVIDTRVEAWKYRPEMHDYFRPETIFGNKFEGYLNSGPILTTRSSEMETSEQLAKEESEQVKQLSEHEIAQKEEAIRKQKEAELEDRKEKEKAWAAFAKKFERKQKEIGIEQVPF